MVIIQGLLPDGYSCPKVLTDFFFPYYFIHNYLMAFNKAGWENGTQTSAVSISVNQKTLKTLLRPHILQICLTKQKRINQPWFLNDNESYILLFFWLNKIEISHLVYYHVRPRLQWLVQQNMESKIYICYYTLTIP